MQNALSHLDGAIEVEINFEAKEAVVRYDREKTTPDRLAQGLAEATQGRYTAKVKS